MQAVILAGGLATRMRPKTEKVPKLLLEVAGRPFVDWQLERLRTFGFEDVVLCIAHLGEPIRDYVGDGRSRGLSVRYSDEGANLLGTAGAIRRALPLLSDTFLVTYGDSYLPFDYAAPVRTLEAHADCDGVMSVFRNRGEYDASNTKVEGGWVRAYEKGTTDPTFDCIDYGALAFRRSVFAELPEGAVLGLDKLQTMLARNGRLRAEISNHRFFEIGSPDGLASLDQHLAAQGQP